MSLNYNKVIIGGNLTRDPELKYTPQGTAIARVGLAINSKYTTKDGTKKEETTFVDVDAFGKTAENAAKYLKKGSSILVEGRLKLDTWDDKTTGQKRSKLGVLADSIQFTSSPKQAAQTEPAHKPASAIPADVMPPEDDVPF